jgi:hypothetical protein
MHDKTIFDHCRYALSVPHGQTVSLMALLADRGTRPASSAVTEQACLSTSLLGLVVDSILAGALQADG